MTGRFAVVCACFIVPCDHRDYAPDMDPKLAKLLFHIARAR